MYIRVLGLLAALVLVTAACANGEGVDEAADDFDEALPPESGEQLPDVDLDEGTAAIVNGAEIPTSQIDDQVDSAIKGDEELAAQLEGDEGEQLLDMFRAQTLTVLVQSRLILDGAAELGAEPTEEDVTEARDELVAELGGEEAFDETIESAGISEEALRDQLESIAALNVVGERLIEEGAADDLPEQPEGAPDADPSDVVVQQWLGERVAQAQVVVNPAYGQWDPQTGQVVPAGGPVMPQAPPPEEGGELPADEGGE